MIDYIVIIKGKKKEKSIFLKNIFLLHSKVIDK